MDPASKDGDEDGRDVIDRLFEGYGDTLTPKQISEILPVSEPHAREMMRNKDIPASKFGGNWFVYTEDLKAELRKEYRSRRS